MAEKRDLETEISSLREEVERLCQSTIELKGIESALRESEEKYRRILETTSEGFFLCDAAGVIIDANQAALKMLGLAREDVIGARPEKYYDPASREFHYADKQHLNFEVRFKSREGDWLPILYKRSTLRDNQGALVGYVSFMTDLTELKTAQKELRAAEKRYRNFYENSVQGMFQSTLGGRMLSVNPAYARILGFSSPREILAIDHLDQVLYFDPEDRRALVLDLQKTGVLTDYELKMKRKDGEVVWLLVNIRLTEDEDGDRIIEGAVLDNTARRKAEEELRRSEKKFRRLSVSDDLTGLYNTRYLYQTLSALIEGRRGSDQPIALIFMDMDDFKKVVDRYGHLKGSLALQETAETIRSCLAEPCFGVAYGGDEFVIVLPGYDKNRGIEKAEQIKDRMRGSVYLRSHGHQVALSASFGVAAFPDDAEDLTGLLAMADKALFNVKAGGKSAVGW